MVKRSSQTRLSSGGEGDALRPRPERSRRSVRLGEWTPGSEGEFLRLPPSFGSSEDSYGGGPPCQRPPRLRTCHPDVTSRRSSHVETVRVRGNVVRNPVSLNLPLVSQIFRCTGRNVRTRQGKHQRRPLGHCYTPVIPVTVEITQTWEFRGHFPSKPLLLPSPLSEGFWGLRVLRSTSYVDWTSTVVWGPWLGALHTCFPIFEATYLAGSVFIYLLTYLL